MDLLKMLSIYPDSSVVLVGKYVAIPEHGDGEYFFAHSST